ncbi:uncharacterized protein TNCV_826351 [Trichonephila clavipes]|nr:uncharacterized protein TNCV_826351 [Trichonephila clavipes]
MNSRRETSENERALVIKWSKDGKSLRETASLIRKSHGCIQKILQKYRRTGCEANIPGRGRKEILSATAKRRVHAWRTPAQAYDRDYLFPTVKHRRGSVIIWTVESWVSIGPIVTLKVRIRWVGRGVSDDRVHPVMQALFRTRDEIFQCDNAPILAAGFV